MLSVLAIGFGSPSSHAAKPSDEPVTTEGCMGEEPEATAVHGRAGSSETYQFDFCSDPTLRLLISLTWTNAKKDLALRVTAPDGTQYLEDRDAGTIEVFGQRAPLLEGTWTVEVINNGNGSVAYGLGIVFAEDADA
jgi:hypothetical protein